MVTLLGDCEEEWYKRAKRNFLIFMCISMLICLVESKLSFNNAVIEMFALIIVFLGIVLVLKKRDEKYLHRMAIRLCYSEWGYCLYYPKKRKFVASIQFNELTKHCRYIYALLDYIAFVRIIYTEDLLKETQNIKILSRDMALLYKDYEEMEGKLWLKLLPLWIIAFLEYSLSDEIEFDTKIELQQSITNKKEEAYIRKFLRSFTVDYYRRMPNEEDRELVNRFIQKVKH